jgi:hypothetical protein
MSEGVVIKPIESIPGEVGKLKKAAACSDII